MAVNCLFSKGANKPPETVIANDRKYRFMGLFGSSRRGFRTMAPGSGANSWESGLFVKTGERFEDGTLEKSRGIYFKNRGEVKFGPKKKWERLATALRNGIGLRASLRSWFIMRHSQHSRYSDDA